jgi:anti-anti-sigma factor
MAKTQSNDPEERRWLRSDADTPGVPFLVDVVSTTDTTTIRFVGELDISSLARAEGIAFEALDKTTARGIVIDMSEVTFCGSAGLSLLIRLTKAARNTGRESVVRRPRPIVRRMISVMGLEEVLNVEDETVGWPGVTRRRGS